MFDYFADLLVFHLAIPASYNNLSANAESPTQHDNYYIKDASQG